MITTTRSNLLIYPTATETTSWQLGTSTQCGKASKDYVSNRHGGIWCTWSCSQQPHSDCELLLLQLNAIGSTWKSALNEMLLGDPFHCSFHLKIGKVSNAARSVNKRQMTNSARKLRISEKKSISCRSDNATACYLLCSPVKHRGSSSS